MCSKPALAESNLPIEDRYERLIQWARDNGTYIHPSLKYANSANRGVEAIVDPGGESIKAREDFIRLPYNLTLSYFNAISAGTPGSHYYPHSKPLPGDFLNATADHDTISAIFLVTQYLLGPRSFWYPYVSTLSKLQADGFRLTERRYIQILPQPGNAEHSALPLLWDSDDLLWLQGTHLENSVRKQREDLERCWHEAILLLTRCGWDCSNLTVFVFPEGCSSIGFTLTDNYCRELGLWAHYILLSRSFQSITLMGDVEKFDPKYRILIEEGVNLDDTVKVLLPVLDSVNHSQEEPLNYCYDVQGLGINKAIEMKPGDRITIAYDHDHQRFNNNFRKYDLISSRVFRLIFGIQS